MKKHAKFAVRILSFLLAAVLLIGPLSLGLEVNAANISSVAASSAVIKKGTTTASYLFVRSGAGTKFDLVSGLWRGTSVDILEEKDGWYRISSGWISSKYVKIASATTSTPTTPSTPSTPSTESTVGNATVTASLLFIRKDPSTNYSAVGMLRKGARIEVLETSGSWLRIKEGWVYAAYVAMDGGSSTVFSEKTHVVVTANELNVRESPSLLAKKVGSLKKNQKVEVLETSGDWLRTAYGWIHKSYVKQVDSASSNNTGTVKASALNVRKGPGTNYEQVGTLWFGQKVTILENQGEWLRISSGWIKASYVKIGG